MTDDLTPEVTTADVTWLASAGIIVPEPADFTSLTDAERHHLQSRLEASAAAFDIRDQRIAAAATYADTVPGPPGALLRMVFVQHTDAIRRHEDGLVSEELLCMLESFADAAADVVASLREEHQVAAAVGMLLAVAQHPVAGLRALVRKLRTGRWFE